MSGVNKQKSYEMIDVFNMLYSRYIRFSKIPNNAVDYRSALYYSSKRHIEWMLSVIEKNKTTNEYTSDKMHRWLGYCLLVNYKKPNYGFDTTIKELFQFYNLDHAATLDKLKTIRLKGFKQLLESLPDDVKYNHITLGYIQGLVVINKKTTVSAERAFTREYLTNIKKVSSNE